MGRRSQPFKPASVDVGGEESRATPITVIIIYCVFTSSNHLRTKDLRLRLLLCEEVKATTSAPLLRKDEGDALDSFRQRLTDEIQSITNEEMNADSVKASIAITANMLTLSRRRDFETHLGCRKARAEDAAAQELGRKIFHASAREVARYGAWWVRRLEAFLLFKGFQETGIYVAGELVRAASGDVTSGSVVGRNSSLAFRAEIELSFLHWWGRHARSLRRVGLHRPHESFVMAVDHCRWRSPRRNVDHLRRASLPSGLPIRSSQSSGFLSLIWESPESLVADFAAERRRFESARLGQRMKRQGLTAIAA
jgi:hypothetical protein